MGSCSCGQDLLGAREASARLFTEGSGRVWNILCTRPWRLQAFKIDTFWAIPSEGINAFQANLVGQRLDEVTQPLPPPRCPRCNQRLYSSRQAAAQLGLSHSGMRRHLASHPERLWAFLVGHRWIVPQKGLNAFQSFQRQMKEKREELALLVSGWTTKRLAQESARLGHPVSLRRIQRLCQSGEIPCKRPGRDYIIADQDAVDCLKQWTGGVVTQTELELPTKEEGGCRGAG